MTITATDEDGGESSTNFALTVNNVAPTVSLSAANALAVDEGSRGKGIGRTLVEWTVDEARRLGIRKLMSLTYEQRFFEKLGFEVVPKESLPLKVWSDCVRCPKRDGCDEIAMVRTLADVPVFTGPAAAPTPRGVSIPVLEHID